MALRATFLLLMIAAALSFSSSPPSLLAEDSKVDITLVSLAGWNGEVSPGTATAGPAGGASTLAAYWRSERAANANTLVLGSGNSFGASPPISNLFDDAPAILSMNAIGFDVDTLGNDNFDHGIAYLQRLLTMADFPFVSANLAKVDQNLSGVRSYQIFELSGVKVAVIGMTDPRSPSLVFPGNFGSIAVTNPYIAAYEARERAEAAGAEVYVLITEMGVTSASPAAGPLIDLASNVTGFDAVLGNGDTMNYSASINGALVVAGQSRGQSYGRTRLQFDTAAGKVTAASAAFVQPLVAGVTPVASIEAMVDLYRSQLTGKLTQVIATSSSAVGQTDVCGQVQGRSCESLTGNAVADAMRSAYKGDIAIVNSGGVRAGLTCPAVDSATDFCPVYQGLPAPITEGQVQAILPFGNLAATVTVSGAELKAMLENGVSMVLDAAGRFPQVSGLCFWYEISRPVGSRVVAAVKQGADGACNGPALDIGVGASYAVVTNDFIAAGGDGYAKPAATVSLRDRLDVVVSHFLSELKTLAPVAQGRINCAGAGCPALLRGTSQLVPTGTGIRPPNTGDGGLR